MAKMTAKQISKSSFQRLPIYLEYLRALLARDEKAAYISATAISNALGLGEVQVRKDLSSISTLGKPKIGYNIAKLSHQLEKFLGYSNVNEAVLVGAGKLGKALLNYRGFAQYGLRIIAAFDADKNSIGKTQEGKFIYPIADFGKFVKKTGVKMGIITVPAESAQAVCDMMIENKICAIWNFANVSLKSPKDILIHSENMAVSLAVLSNHLSRQLNTVNKRRKTWTESMK
ncbi:MAG: redox-sensing transcriptional repressor Rex [Elusimicrobiota bacterium]|jgi:redox-sensing transcriptional repressor|nr:redox-sensing transcriptional repressor Rex [Elusimicrobiota bacterium]